MKKRCIVIGAGRQGPAVAYDLAKFGDGLEVCLADFDLGAAQKGSEIVSTLLPGSAVRALEVDVQNKDGLVGLLKDFDMAIAASPYRLNPLISHAAIDAGCHAVDMGVDTPDAIVLHARTDEASAKGLSIVTDCGIAPGLVNILAMRLLEELPTATNIRLYCGGLPVSAEAPIYHKVGFSVESLLGEYVDDVESLRNGQVVVSEALQDFESLEFPGFGTLEAVTTSGGTGTAPYQLVGRLQSYEYKTLRYPGHWRAMEFMRDFGLWSEDALPSGDVPRRVSLALMERAMVSADTRDVVVTRVVASDGFKTLGYDLVDRFDEQTGFTGMQRTTGFSTAIVAHQVLAGNVKAGCGGCETAVKPEEFMALAAKRGFAFRKIS